MKKALAAAGLGAALTLGSLVGASPASAYSGSEVSYLNALNYNGFVTYNANWAINTGWQICNSLNYENGNAAAVDLFANTSWADVPNLHVAQIWVNTAADTLCPWVWNNGSVRAIF